MEICQSQKQSQGFQGSAVPFVVIFTHPTVQHCFAKPCDSGEHGCIQINCLIWASPASNPKSRKVKITVFTTLLIFGIRDWNLKLTIFFSYYFKSYQAATCFLLSGFTNFILIYLHKLGLLLYIILNSIPLPRKIINAIFNTKNNKKIKWIIFLNKY